MAHIWLLHHLFLPLVDQDAQKWAHTWNNHTLQIRGERNRSPRDMFFFSMYDNGPRGVQHHPVPQDEQIDDIQTYGIDWEDAQDPALMDHLLVNNPQDRDKENPFNMTHPSTLSDVPCEPPNCPFTPQQLQLLDSTLADRVDMRSRSIVVRRAIWSHALNICREIYRTIHN